MRKLALTLLVALSLAGVGASIAHASNPQLPDKMFDSQGYLTEQAQAYFDDPTLYPPPVPGDTTTQDEIDSLMTRARRKAGVIPSLKSRFGGTGASTGMALRATGYAAMVYMGLNGYADLYTLLTGGSSDIGTNTTHASGGGNYRVWKWKHYDAGTTLQGITNGGSGTPSYLGAYGVAPRTGWYAYFQSCGSSACTDNVTAEPAVEIASWVSDPTAIGHPIISLLQLELPGVALMPYSDNGSTRFWTKFMTDSDYEEKFSEKRSTVTTFNSYSGDKIYITNVTPGQMPASGDGPQTIRKPGVTQTQQQKDTEAAVDAQLDGDPNGGDGPSGSGAPAFAPFVIPRPYLYESYQEYLDRLRSRGWVGSVTLGVETDTGRINDLTAGGVNALAVSSVQVGVGSIADVLAWPLDAPKITGANQSVSLQYQPADAPSPTPRGAGVEFPTGADPTPETDCPCDVHAIDYTPLKDLSLGDKFPFGIFAWITTPLAALSTTPVAPNWTFPVHMGFTENEDVGTPSAGDGDWTVDLSDGDPFMSVIRNIEAALFAVGTLLWLAFKILGMDAPSGGDGIEGEEA